MARNDKTLARSKQTEISGRHQIRSRSLPCLSPRVSLGTHPDQRVPICRTGTWSCDRPTLDERGKIIPHVTSLRIGHRCVELRDAAHH